MMLWLQHTDPSCPWGSMEVKEDRATTAFFKASPFFRLGNGHTAHFWMDAWIEGRSIADIVLDLVTTVASHRRTR
jgi:hypothetical protein